MARDGVKICVAGGDLELRKQCQAVLEDIAADGWEVITSSLQAELPEADVYIWDFQPEYFPRRLSTETVRTSLFVLEAQHLGRFRELLGDKRASILLKPVQPVALKPFLEHSMRQFRPSVSNPRPASEKDDLLDCLLYANLQLQEYDQARTNFLARAVHDFRAPLTALNGYCGLLTSQRLGPLNTVQVDLLNRMQQSIKRVTRLADAMFDLSVRRRVKKELDLQVADMEACINQAVHEITPHAEEKRIRLSVSVESPDEPLIIDSAKIEQVLVNLLENSCKFTPKQGAIEVSGYPVFWHSRSTQVPVEAASEEDSMEPNAYRIDVRDTGSGISSEHIESVFEEYTSYAGGKDRSGGGLGLAICRMIVDEHGGIIWAESGASGTQFSFVIPHSAAHIQPMETASVPRKDVVRVRTTVA